MERQLKITPDNLIVKLPEIGPWSTYSLAETAIKYYSPLLWGKGREPNTWEVSAELERLGFKYWQDIIIKYHNEIGYNESELNHVTES